MRHISLAAVTVTLACQTGATCPTDPVVVCPPATSRWTEGSREACSDASGWLHGPVVARFEDGCTSMRGQYQHGREVGAWTWYRRTGEPELVGEYVVVRYRDSGSASTTPPHCNALPERARKQCEVSAKFSRLFDGRLSEPRGALASAGCHGTWTKLDRDGVVMKQVTFDDGRVIDGDPSIAPMCFLETVH